MPDIDRDFATAKADKLRKASLEDNGDASAHGGQ